MCVYVCVCTCQPESPSFLTRWRVTRSFERHDSITISVTRENSSRVPLFSPPRSSSASGFPREATRGTYHRKLVVAFARASIRARIFHVSRGRRRNQSSLPPPSVISHALRSERFSFFVRARINNSRFYGCRAPRYALCIENSSFALVKLILFSLL